jgi:hypothetical protein
MAATVTAILALTSTIPQTFTADITVNTTGTAKSAPMGVQTYKQFYDYGKFFTRCSFLCILRCGYSTTSYLTLSLLLFCLLFLVSYACFASFLASLFRSANKRLRKDSSNGMTKVYRYDKNIMPPITPGPNDPDFASPKGYQFQLSNVRTTLFSSRMFLLFQLYHYCSTVFILLTIEI